MEIMEDVVIVGAGIAGVATALALKRVGIRSLVLEKAEGLRTTGTGISFAQNAWLALDALGVAQTLLSQYSPFLNQTITNVTTGAVKEISFPRKNAKRPNLPVGVVTIHRKNLLEALAKELDEGCIRFSSKITSIENQEQGGASIAILHLQDGTTIKAKVLIGCDGVHSIVAKWLGLSTPISTDRLAVRALAVYPDGHGLEHKVMQFVDPGKRAGFVPLNDTEIYWFFTWQGETMSMDPKEIQTEILEKEAKNFPPLYLDVTKHVDLSTMSCAPLIFRHPREIIFGTMRKGNVTVAGDAMHPMTPDLGQGGCSALEDAVVLGRQIGNSFIKNGGVLIPEDMAGAIDGYLKERKWRTAALVTGSFLSGWVQQDGSTWWMKFLRDSIFYKFVFAIFAFLVLLYDCGKLPTATSCTGQLDHSSKKD